MKKFLTVFVVMILSLVMHGQRYTLEGVVTDNNDETLIGATLTLLNPGDSVLVSFGTTNNDGKFSIPGVRKGKYLFQITYIGFGTVERILEVGGENQKMDLGRIKLGEQGKLLDEVTVTAEYIPIQIKKDTLEFNADAFRTQPNAVVEDLLKRLPGVEVESDGAIKVQGEDVKRVTVDGKDFFGTDPKMATRNLPADAIKKVQVFDKKSRSAEFTGIDDGNDEKTINLELKADRKTGKFGNVLAGYGTDNRYEGKLLGNMFSKKVQTSVIATHNNLNQTGISSSDFSSFAIGNNSGGGRMGGNFGGAPVNFSGNNNGLIQGGTLGVNMNFDLGKKNTIYSSYYLTQGKTDLVQETSSENFLPDRVFFSRSLLDSDSRNLNHNVSATLQYNLDSTSQISFINSLSFGQNGANSVQQDTTLNELESRVNRNQKIRDQESGNLSYSGELNFRKRLSRIGRNYTIDLRYATGNTRDTSHLTSEVFNPQDMIILQTSVYQEQQNITGRNNYSVGGTYTEPLLDNVFLTFSGSYRNNNNFSDKRFYDIDFLLESPVFNDQLSRYFDNAFVYALGGTNLRYKTDLFNANAGVEYQNSSLSGKIRNETARNISFSYFLPQASIQFEKINMRINYSTNVREPSIDQLQPIVDNSDPLNVYTGNPDLQPEYRHNMRIFYGLFDQFNFRSLFTSIRLTYTKDKISNSTFTDQNFIRKTMPRNTENEINATFFANYSAPLNFMKAKFRTGLNSSLTDGINFINDEPADIQRWSHGINFTLENKKKDIVDVSAGLRWNYNNTRYLQNDALNVEFFNQVYNAMFIWNMGKAWSWEIKYDYTIFDETSFGDNNEIHLLESSVSKRILKDQLTFKIRAFDILDQNAGISRTAADNYVREVITNTIGRYFLFSVQYNLNKGPDTKSQQTRVMMFHG